MTAAIAFTLCGCIQTGADVVIDVDGYDGLAFMMEQSPVSAVPIPLAPIYQDINVGAEETTDSQDPDNTDNTENTEQTTTEQVPFPVDDEPAGDITWEEMPLNKTMYVNTEGVSSRARAVMGSEKANRFGLNQEVTVIAITNTDYYKLDNETYIHVDYLSDEMTAVTIPPITEATTTTTTTTAEPKTDPPQTTPRETEPPQTVQPATEPPSTPAPETTSVAATTPETTTEPPATVPPETEPPATTPEITEPPVTEPTQEPTFEFEDPFFDFENLPELLSKYPAKLLKNEPKTNLRGIDISWAQGVIDWEAVARSGIDFAYIRAGRGDIDGSGPKADKYFLQNIREANKYGIKVGVYFYSYALTEEQARAEARLTLDLIEGHTVTYPVVFDLEEWMDRPNLEDIARAFMDTIAEAGYYPMLYSYRYGIDGHFSKEFAEAYPLWVAQRNTRPETYYDFYIWQHSFTGQVNGIKGNVDLDVSFVDFHEFFMKYGINNLSAFSF